MGLLDQAHRLGGVVGLGVVVPHRAERGRHVDHVHVRRQLGVHRADGGLHRGAERADVAEHLGDLDAAVGGIERLAVGDLDVVGAGHRRRRLGGGLLGGLDRGFGRSLAGGILRARLGGGRRVGDGRRGCIDRGRRLLLAGGERQQDEQEQGEARGHGGIRSGVGQVPGLAAGCFAAGCFAGVLLAGVAFWAGPRALRMRLALASRLS